MSESQFKDEASTDETLILHEAEISVPEVKLLDRYPFQPCDGHENPTIQAIIEFAGVQLCGNCAHKTGVASHQNLPTWLRQVDAERKQGSEN